MTTFSKARQTIAADGALISAALRRAYAQAGMAEPVFAMKPGERGDRGPEIKPVSLAFLISAFNLTSIGVPGLTRAAAGAELHKQGLDFPALLDDATPLAGFIFANDAGGLIMVRGDDPLVRRRFSAAHELGHYLMHWRGQSAETGPFILADEPSAVWDDEPSGEASSDDPDGGRREDAVTQNAGWTRTGASASTAAQARASRKSPADDASPRSASPDDYEAMERQANRFAAEVLMPEAVCRGAFEYYVDHGGSIRFIENHIATQLLVSRQALRWRLGSLGLISTEF